ncbi:MAG: oligosaccharide flippase family protein [Pseudonocardiaceae bacterium]
MMDEDQVGAMAAAESSTQAIGRKASQGLRWSVLGILVVRVGNLGIGLVLARLLTPADFGVYAIALAATDFVTRINDGGLVAATVQWRGRLDEMAPTTTTLAAIFSIAVYGMFWFAAPSFADLAGSPHAAPVVRLLTTTILIDGVTALRVGTILRDFQQDKITKVTVAGFVVNTVTAISLARHGAGPYSFAGGQLAGAVITGTLVVILAKVPFRIGFDRVIAVRLMRFGMPLAAGLGIEAILLNTDYVVVGRIMGATALGFYLLAFNISSWVQGVVGTAVRYVSVASFSRLAEQNEDVLSLGVQRSAPLLIAGILPIAMLMAVLAPSLVVFLYGGRWAPAVPALRFLMVLTVVRLLTSFATDILVSAGATRATFWLNLGWVIALVPTLIIGTQLGGIRGTAIAHAIVAVLVAAPLAIWILRRARVRLAPIGPALVRPLLAAGFATATCLAVAAVAPPSPFAQLATAGTAGLLVYVATALPLAVLRRIGGRVRALIPACHLPASFWKG